VVDCFAPISINDASARGDHKLSAQLELDGDMDSATLPYIRISSNIGCTNCYHYPNHHLFFIASLSRLDAFTFPFTHDLLTHSDQAPVLSLLVNAVATRSCASSCQCSPVSENNLLLSVYRSHRLRYTRRPFLDKGGSSVSICRGVPLD